MTLKMRESITNTQVDFYVRITVEDDTANIEDASIYMSFSREATQEELDFAKAADECP
jgi:hypothetical protein